MKKEFRVSGLRCPSCERLVEEALGELDGVDLVKASHAEGVVEVDYDPEMISPAAIGALIEEQGFKVLL
ncbi:MAG: heavy-metal-associated domain-containing protein [Chlorobi bacterium]|nr:heavy-metal-associated domain-containing protein [Chlorobiota bacterium]